MPITNKMLDNWFTHHPPQDSDVANYQDIRKAGRQFALAICNATPPGVDQNVAIRKVREAVMTANAAIACRDR